MANQHNSGMQGKASKRSQNGRQRKHPAHDGRLGTMTKLAAIGGLVLSVGSVLYRLRRRWVPKAEEWAAGVRDRAKRASHAGRKDMKEDSPGYKKGGDDGHAKQNQIL